MISLILDNSHLAQYIHQDGACQTLSNAVQKLHIDALEILLQNMQVREFLLSCEIEKILETQHANIEESEKIIVIKELLKPYMKEEKMTHQIIEIPTHSEKCVLS